MKDKIDVILERERLKIPIQNFAGNVVCTKIKVFI